jgi:hypothetical protein
MDAPATARLHAARLLAFYLVTLVALAGADLAWRAPSLGRLASWSLGLGLALLVGATLRDLSSAWAAAGARRRARLVGGLLLPLPGLLALVVALFAPDLAPRVVTGFAAIQLLALVVSDALALEIVALWGALVLTLIAAVGGGLPALVSLPAFLLLAPCFFALDHAARRLAAWPNVAAPPVRRLLAEALGAVAVPVVLLVLALALLPSPALEATAEARRPATVAEVQRAYGWLAMLALVGGGATVLVMRWLRGGGGRDESVALVELPESHVLAEEILDPPAAGGPRYAPARGRVIKAYLRVLARAGEAGLRLERHLTPREIQERVRQPADPLATLTGLFMDARYGPDEPTPLSVQRAEAASRAVCSGLRARPGARGPLAPGRRPERMAGLGRPMAGRREN